MKKILVITIILVGLFSINAFGQSQEDIDLQALEKAQKTLAEMSQQDEEQIMSAFSEIVYSKNPSVFNIFKGTVWTFSYTIINTFEYTIAFGPNVFKNEGGDVYLPFVDEFGNIGVAFYILSGAESTALASGITEPFYYMGFSNDPFYYMFNFNSINPSLVSGACLLKDYATGIFSNYYPLLGVKIQSTLPPIYVDDDGDGYTENQGDCDDSNRFIYPGAIEICGDGIDQDCNGSDLACGPAPQDVDDDGDGYTENQGDCNDNNNTVYPGATEICGDGIDQDCNGSDLPCANTPSAPKGVTASDGTLSGMVQVSWNPSTGATSYDIYRADIPAWAGGVPKLITASVTGTSYNDTSAVSGKQYYYWVKAKNGNIGSGYSMFDPGYWGARGYVPSVPVNVAASDGTVPGKVTVTWTAVPNSVVYEIYRADYPAYLGGNIRNIGISTTTSYNDATVVNGNQYYYWVKARNSWGVSGYSKFDTGYIGASSPLLPPPTGVAATDGGSGKVTLSWNAVSGALIYEVYRAAKPAYEGGVPSLLGTVKNPGATYNDASITCGPTYYYWVKARNSWGSSGYSKFDTGYCTGP